MKKLLLLLSITSVSTKETELPLCPTNVQFFPQALPMHCRMPVNGILPGVPQLFHGKSLPTAPPNLPPFYQSPPPGQQGNPMPLIVPSGIPQPIPLGSLGPMTFGGPGPMPVPPPVPSHKLPVIVMPFYSPDPAFKKAPKQKYREIKKKRRIHKRPRYDSAFDTDTSVGTDFSSDTSHDESTDREWWSKRIARNKNRRFNRKYKSKKIKRKHNERKGMLTPLLQYVTKDGYVIYEKKISNGEAQDWLDTRGNDQDNNNKELDKQLDGLNFSNGLKPKIEQDLNQKVSREEENENYNKQKPHSKRTRTRGNDPIKMTTRRK